MSKKLAPPIFFLLALMIYAPALRAQFVWDDQALVLGDPLIRSWRLAWEGFQHFLFVDATASNFYRPLQRLTYLADYAAFDFSPFGYHLVSILWHATATTALFFFAEELLAICDVEKRRTLIAFFSALIWLVHPVQNAAVAYVSGRADPLSAAFGFCGLYFALRMWRESGMRKLALGLLVSLCFLASALSKESGLLFLALWLVLIARKHRMDLWRTVGAVAAVLVVYGSLRWPSESFSPPENTPESLMVRPIVVARGVAEYAGLLILPLHLRMDRDVETHPFGFVRQSLDGAAWRELQTLLGLGLMGAFVLMIWRSRNRSELFLPLLLGVVAYLPVSGLVPLNASVAEHWLYLPSTFLFIAASAAFFSLGEIPARSWRIATRVCLASWLIFLSVRTFVRAGDWQDQRTFLQSNIAGGGASTRMWINLGALELSEGNLPAARRAEELSLTREPSQPLALLNLAAIEIRQQEFARAREALGKIRRPPELVARAQESLVVLENRETGRVDLVRLRLAARLGAQNWAIEKRYINALAAAGDTEGAIGELRTCLTTAPYRAESWQMLSDLLARAGRHNQAAVAQREAEEKDVHLPPHLAAR